MRVLICSEHFPIARPTLQARLPHDEVLTCPADAVLAALPGVDVVIPAMARVDGAVMDAGHFRLIQQWGAGLEGVDLAAARARGVWVANVPSSATGNATAVAEAARQGAPHPADPYQADRAAGQRPAQRRAEHARPHAGLRLG